MYAPEGEWAQARLDELIAPPAPTGDAGAGTWPRMFDAITTSLDVVHPPHGARVLDFGCGRGKFLDVLQQCGWETFGIEPAMDVAFHRHRRLTDVPADASFDLVLVNHVLEHVTDPLALLRQFAAAARPGGYLLVGVPRLDTLPVHQDRNYVISRVHIRAYTSACMTELLRRSLWDVVEPPPDVIQISGGRMTAARLRILARRREGNEMAPAATSAPLDPARQALQAYHRGPKGGAPVFGSPRLQARLMETKRSWRRWVRMLTGAWSRPAS